MCFLWGYLIHRHTNLIEFSVFMQSSKEGLNVLDLTLIYLEHDPV